MKELIIKIAKAKKEIGKISKDSTNPFFKSKYFDINQLLEHVEGILSEHKLMVLQPIIQGSVITRIYDIESGEFIDSAIDLPNLTDPQKLGSAITYFRRYTLQSLLSLQAEDDDGNKASKTTTQTTGTTAKKAKKAWLNVRPSKQSKEYTIDFINSWKACNGGGFTVADIRKKYAVSTETESYLNNKNLNPA